MQARLSCFFRDDELSDLIGFSYATWRGDDAAANLVHELLERARRLDGAPGHVVLIALDGENAWEHYPFNGYFFLSALYAALAAHPALELTTLSQCTARGLVACNACARHRRQLGARHACDVDRGCGKERRVGALV
jgi:alpha-amylase/alpha-mannosidase (GH57 family)